MSARHEPSPIPRLYFAHAFAKLVLMDLAWAVPPVIEETQRGISNLVPKNDFSISESTGCADNSGS